MKTTVHFQHGNEANLWVGIVSNAVNAGKDIAPAILMADEAVEALRERLEPPRVQPVHGNLAGPNGAPIIG